MTESEKKFELVKSYSQAILSNEMLMRKLEKSVDRNKVNLEEWGPKLVVGLAMDYAKETLRKLAEDDDEILQQCDNIEMVQASENIEVGMLLLVHRTLSKRVFIYPENASQYPIEDWAAIGVVVIPSSHNVYGDGCAGVMSLFNLCCDLDKHNGTNRAMYWGNPAVKIDLPKMVDAVTCGKQNNQSLYSDSVYKYPYMPSDAFAGFARCLHDYNAVYNCVDTAYVAPSPYLTDGDRNPMYYQKLLSNCLADFDGRHNTDTILALRGEKDYKSWVPQFNSSSDYPAASVCDAFHTLGTKEGDWYLPAMGELGYVVARKNLINKAIVVAKERYLVGAPVGAIELWSSTVYNDSEARYLNMENGAVEYAIKDIVKMTRAFMKANPSDFIIDYHHA